MPEKLTSITKVKDFVTTKVPVFNLSHTPVQIKEELISKSAKYEEIEFVYFVDDEEKLVGVTKLSKILQSDEDSRLSDLVERDCRVCFAESSLEKALSIATHHSIEELPVTTKDGVFKGVLTSQTMLKAVARLYAGKTYRHGGILHDKPLLQLVLEGSTTALVKARIPWLLVGLIGVMMTANILSIFEETLQKNILLALFIPAIAYMSNAVGIQSETLFIRTLAIKEGLSSVKYAIKDFFVTTILGTIIGSSLFALTFFWKKDLEFSIILGLSMFVNISLASVITISIPAIFRKLGKDPAIVSGPLATIIQDLVSLVIYFMIAFYTLQFFGK